MGHAVPPRPPAQVTMSAPNPAMLAHIAYVERSSLSTFALPERGFMADPDARLYSALGATVAFAPRGPLEEDPSRKQLIPYIVLGDARRVFVTRRTRAQTEARLHDKMSLGVGGHLEPTDGDASDLIHAGAVRELLEELVLPEDLAAHLLYRGVINDDTSDVGSVHLGVVYSLEIPDTTNVSVREVDKMLGSWMTHDEIGAYAPRLESWSTMLLDALEDFFRVGS